MSGETPTIGDLARHRNQPPGATPRRLETTKPHQPKPRERNDVMRPDRPEEEVRNQKSYDDDRETPKEAANRLMTMKFLLARKEQELAELRAQEQAMHFAFQERLRDITELGRAAEALRLNKETPDAEFRLENDCVIAMAVARTDSRDRAMAILDRLVKTSTHPEAARLYQSVSRVIQETGKEERKEKAA